MNSIWLLALNPKELSMNHSNEIKYEFLVNRVVHIMFWHL